MADSKRAFFTVCSYVYTWYNIHQCRRLRNILGALKQESAQIEDGAKTSGLAANKKHGPSYSEAAQGSVVAQSWPRGGQRTEETTVETGLPDG
jgi:hypothetical protein